MNSTRWLHRLLLPLLLLPTLVTADGAEDLRAFLRDVERLQADFTQVVYQQGRTSAQRSAGRFQLWRPGRFRWDYLTPYRQEIVADGSRLWFYDTDLEQITVKPLEEGLGSTPALLLTGSDQLDQQFTITPLAGGDGEERWVELAPTGESNYSAIRLAFQRGTLRTMEVIDGLGQTTRLEFSAVNINPELDPALFRFTPPPGVDLLGDPG